MIETRSWWEPQIPGRVKMSVLTCDRCDATYPEDGKPEEGGAVIAEVFEGWDRLDQLDLCPACQVERAIWFLGREE